MPCAFKCIILCPGSGSVLAQTCGAVNDITLIIMSERDLHAELRALELSTMRVGLIGLGAINTVVARMLCVDDKVENAALVAVLCRNVQSHVEKSSGLHGARVALARRTAQAARPHGARNGGDGTFNTAVYRQYS